MIQSTLFYITIIVVAYGCIFFWPFIRDRTVHVKRARRDICALVHGIRLYVDQYKRAPVIDFAQDEQPPAELLQILCGSDWNFGRFKAPLPEYIAAINPAGTNFIPSLMCKMSVGVALRDPWGEPYHIALDTNGDGKTEIGCDDNQSLIFDITSERKTRVSVVSPVAVWSNGINRWNECGYGDDVCSWSLNNSEPFFYQIRAWMRGAYRRRLK